MTPVAALRRIHADLDMVMDRDPSILSRSEALLHPTVIAIWGHRLSHRLHLKGHRRSARLVMVLARLLTGGIEIHPGATIGRGFFIDHGAGVVIGETVVIGDDVTIFHQVTLGAVGWWHDNQRPEGSRRHPKLGDRVVIGANATLLGPITVGHDSVVGAQALVIRDVPADSRVLAPFSVPALKSTRGVVKAARVRHPVATTPRHKGAVFPTW
ncbi:serine O-acetyltransferase EpsC [Lentzea sp. JNUCC 0626]|uniref:serine O-acetyltransferase EpsC n=1 Tax=Lentzea sp. JNUCC 0626 TaxID=3367513 RepID=UPI0037490D2C